MRACVLLVALLSACAPEPRGPAPKAVSDGVPKGWSATSPMSVPRFLHTATLLPDRRVLITGGCKNTGAEQMKRGLPPDSTRALEVVCLGAHRSAEVYDPNKGKFVPVSDMGEERFEHQAVLVPTGSKSTCGPRCGQVLVVGGNLNNSNGNRSTAEVFNPKTASWSSAPSPEPLASGSLVAIPARPRAACGKACGKVLMIGRTLLGGSAAALYDPVKNSWQSTATPPVQLGFPGFTTTLLPSGEVLVLGALASVRPAPGVGGGRAFPADPAVYQPAKGRWRLLNGAGSVFRSGHTATLLNKGRVLIAGGVRIASNSVLGSAELFDAGAAGGSGRFKPVRSLGQARRYHLAVPLGKSVMVTGGGPPLEPPTPGVPAALPGPETYDVGQGKWFPIGGAPEYRGSLRKTISPVFTATPLSANSVLFAGGIDADDRALASAEIYSAP